MLITSIDPIDQASAESADAKATVLLLYLTRPGGMQTQTVALHIWAT